MRREFRKGSYKLFLPPPDRELSVARVDGLSHDDIRAIGAIGVTAGGTLLGHVTLLAEVVFKNSLSFVADGDPYARHASIVSWSGVPPQDRLIAQALAEASTLTEYV
jgi:hypothetical protein